MNEGRKSEEVKNIIRKNNYFLCSYSFLYFESVPSEKKKRILKFLTLILEKKIIELGGEGEDIISKVIPVTKEIEEEGKKDDEKGRAGVAPFEFRLYEKRNGWIKEEECDQKQLEEKNKKSYYSFKEKNNRVSKNSLFHSSSSSCSSSFSSSRSFTPTCYLKQHTGNKMSNNQ